MRNWIRLPSDEQESAEAAEVGKVVTKLKLTNHADFIQAGSGSIAPDAVRSLEIEALVDTGATMLALPEDVVAALGTLRPLLTQPTRRFRAMLRE